MENKQLTAVEWLIEQIGKKFLINNGIIKIEKIADEKLYILGHKFPTKKSKDRFYEKRVLRVVDKDSGMNYLYLDFKTKRILLVAFDPQTITIHD